MIKNGMHFHGVEIQLLKDVQERMHSHAELEIMYIVKGAIHVSTLKNTYYLKQGDIILFNMNDSHSIESEGPVILCKISLSYQVLTENINDGNYLFFCNSSEDKTRSFIDLQTIIKRMMLALVTEQRKTNCFIQGLVYELLDILIEQFQNTMIGIQNKEKDQQMQFIFNYINVHYREPLHLEEIANLLYTSKSTISRLFKKETGVYFADYLNQLRLNYALKELLETTYPITKVAVDCGFSNPSVFSKIFQDKFHSSPSAYRKKESHQDTIKEELSEQDWKLIQQSIKDEVQTKFEEHQKQSITIVAQQGIEYKKTWNTLVNAGATHNLTLANFQQHILFLVEELGFTHVRIWNIFSNKMMILQDASGLKYNFNLIDQVLDFLVNHHVKAFIDFGRRDDVAVSTEMQMVYHHDECISFEHEEEWQRLFSAFIDHIINRYGSEETETWIYEFTADMREQDLFYDKRNEIPYEPIYAYGYQKIKKHMPNAMVGGVGAGVSDVKKIDTWLSYCKTNDCVPDFASIMVFPYLHVTQEGIVFPKRVADVDSIFNKVEEIDDFIKFLGFSNCELIVTEWNQSLSNRNLLNDSCFRATYVMRCIIKMWNIPTMMGLWMGTDWVSSYYDTSKIANGGSGMITKDHIKKPVFYALKLLNYLGSQFLQKDDQYLATTNGKDNYYILCANYKQYSPYYFMQDEDRLDVEHLSLLFENHESKEVVITLDHMPEREFFIKQHTIDPDEGSILGEWAKFQYEEQMTKSDVQYLSDVCTPHLAMERRAVEHGQLQISATIKAHEIVLFHIYPK